MEFVIITGMSGAGKRTANHILEDMGYHCVDNIPFTLMETCIALYQSDHRFDKISFTLDIRGENDFSGLIAMIRKLRKENNCICRLIYLDADERVLVARYQESRHLHPLLQTDNLPLQLAIAKERELLADLRETADLVLDTTEFRPIDTRERLEEFLSISREENLRVTCVSFGFKHGAPTDLDLLFDVRCFENPFYIQELKPLTGLDAHVRDFVLKSPDVIVFMDKLKEMIDFLLPRYLAEGKSRLTIGIGCTGGQHRSVAIAEALADHLRSSSGADGNRTVSVLHRDCRREK